MFTNIIIIVVMVHSRCELLNITHSSQKPLFYRIFDPNFCTSQRIHPAIRQAFRNSAQVLYILSKGLVMLNKKVGAYGEVWGEDFVLSDTWRLSYRIDRIRRSGRIHCSEVVLFVPSWLLISAHLIYLQSSIIKQVSMHFFRTGFNLGSASLCMMFLAYSNSYRYCTS